MSAKTSHQSAAEQAKCIEIVGGAVVPDRRLDVVVTGLSSDSHTWNLVYLQLLLEELGCRVTNLGGCAPDEMIVRECLSRRPDLVAVSSLNGHGWQDGRRLIAAVRQCPALTTIPVVIGGKLDATGGVGGTAARLLAAGFDAVFEDADGLTPFRSFVFTLAARSSVPIGAG
jgi:methylaspartate mutase sigma subunit